LNYCEQRGSSEHVIDVDVDVDERLDGAPYVPSALVIFALETMFTKRTREVGVSDQCSTPLLLQGSDAYICKQIRDDHRTQ
jgi:hypothetical protein